MKVNKIQSLGLSHNFMTHDTDMNPHFERELADIWIAEMRSITGPKELEEYAKTRARKFQMSAHVEELRRMFGERKNELAKPK